MYWKWIEITTVPFMKAKRLLIWIAKKAATVGVVQQLIAEVLACQEKMKSSRHTVTLSLGDW